MRVSEIQARRIELMKGGDLPARVIGGKLPFPFSVLIEDYSLGGDSLRKLPGLFMFFIPWPTCATEKALFKQQKKTFKKRTFPQKSTLPLFPADHATSSS